MSQAPSNWLRHCSEALSCLDNKILNFEYIIDGKRIVVIVAQEPAAIALEQLITTIQAINTDHQSFRGVEIGEVKNPNENESKKPKRRGLFG